MAAGVVAADVVGLRRTLVVGLAVLALGSLAGVPASAAWQLMAARALEGVGFILVTVVALADAAGGWGSSWVLTVGASLLGLALTPLALRAPRARGPWGMRSARRSRPRPPGRA